MAANFFSKLPRLQYSFLINGSKQQHDLANITIKYALSYKQSKDLSSLYKFYWVENLRPDTFAEKYYGSNELYWLGLSSSGIYDVHNELPKNDTQLFDYLFKKYKDSEGFIGFLTEMFKNDPLYTRQNDPEYNYPPSYKYSEDSHALMLSEQTNYDNMYSYVSNTVHHYKDSDGDVVDQAFNPNSSPVTILDYEEKENEDKRLVNIIDSYYASQIRTEFDNAMNELQADLKNV